MNEIFLNLFPMFFLFDFFADINLILKIFVLMTLVSWVRNHLGTGALSWILIGAMGYFILFDGWAIFGPIYLLYMLLMFGVSAVLIDFFFRSAGCPPQQEEGMESPVSSGVDLSNRMKGAHAASAAQRILRR